MNLPPRRLIDIDNEVEIQDHVGYQQGLLQSTQQVFPDEIKRVLSNLEQGIINAINVCLRSWYEPWRSAYLKDGHEFKIVSDLMDHLLYYEYQITSSATVLSTDKANSIAKAVARLIDSGNAILNLDIIIRNNDETSSEMDAIKATTIELYQAHVRANKLRENLVNDYFKKDYNSLASSPDESSITLQIPNAGSNNQLMVPSPSSKSFIGSNSSINTASEGRKISQVQNHIEIQVQQNDHSRDPEISQLIGTLSSDEFWADGNSAVRVNLLPGMFDKIEALLDDFNKVEVCFEAIDALIDRIQRLSPEFRTREVVMTYKVLLRPILRKVQGADQANRSHWTSCLVGLVQLMKAQDFNVYRQHLSGPKMKDFLLDYLLAIRRTVSSSCLTCINRSEAQYLNDQKPAYPDCWIDMKLHACSSFLISLTNLRQIISQFYPTNSKVWTSYIECLVTFVLQNALRPDKVMLRERQVLKAAQIRQNAVWYLRSTWNMLSKQIKESLISEFVEPLLAACIVVDVQLRPILLPIFYDMMRCDYSSQYSTANEMINDSSSGSTFEDENEDGASLSDLDQSDNMKNFDINESLPYLSLSETCDDGTVLTRFTHLVVGKLNNLMIDLKMGDQRFKEEFCLALRGELKLNSHQVFGGNRNPMIEGSDYFQFGSMARHTADLLAEFMDICLELRQSDELGYKHLYQLSLFRMVQFFRDKVDRVELYLQYLFQLYHLHLSTGQFVEAGYTLLERAKSLPWSSEPIAENLRLIRSSLKTLATNGSPLTYSTLKIALYNSVIDHFDEGQLWEAAVPICRELVDHYELVAYDYAKVSRILSKMSKFFTNMTNPNRYQPSYFQITFYGMGFPVSLRGKTFVHRGKPFEKLHAFESRVLASYPDATPLRTLTKPDESLISEPTSRLMQITACQPVVDLMGKFGDQLDSIQESILNYHRHNQCYKFQFSCRTSRPNVNGVKCAGGNPSSGDDFKNIWREKTTLTTSTLPGMLPFFAAFLIEKEIVSPIGCAIEDLQSTNDRLLSTVKRFRADRLHHREDARQLLQLITGVVNAAVNGGIAKYERAFLEHVMSEQPLAGSSPSSGPIVGHRMRKTSDGGVLKGDAVNRGQELHVRDMDKHTAGLANGHLAKISGPAHGRIEPDTAVAADVANYKQTTAPGQQYISNSYSNITIQRPKPMNPIIDHRHHRQQAQPCAVASSLNPNAGQPNNNSNNNNGSNNINNTNTATNNNNDRQPIDHDQQPSAEQLDKLKTLIARQVPLLDEAIELQRDRVADASRPQHDLLEATYKDLKSHVLANYFDHLPSDYRSLYRQSRQRSYRRSGDPTASFFPASPSATIASRPLGTTNHSDSQPLGARFNGSKIPRHRVSDSDGSSPLSPPAGARLR